MAARFRDLSPLKKCTAGFANPDSPCVVVKFPFSSQAKRTSSAAIPYKTLSRCPVSICQTCTVPSAHPMIRKSSSGRHFIEVMGNKCRDASRTHFFSRSDKSAAEWSLETLHTVCNTRVWKKQSLLFKSFKI